MTFFAANTNTKKFEVINGKPPTGQHLYNYDPENVKPYDLCQIVIILNLVLGSLDNILLRLKSVTQKQATVILSNRNKEDIVIGTISLKSISMSEPKSQYIFQVWPEYFTPPKQIGFLEQIAPALNITQIARMTGVRHPNTFLMRMKRGTVMGNSPEHKQFSQDTGEVLNEMFWVLGVGLGHFPEDPHKTYKHFPKPKK